jgi:hypothetical protein
MVGQVDATRRARGTSFSKRVRPTMTWRVPGGARSCSTCSGLTTTMERVVGVEYTEHGDAVVGARLVGHGW